MNVRWSIETTNAAVGRCCRDLVLVQGSTMCQAYPFALDFFFFDMLSYAYNFKGIDLWICSGYANPHGTLLAS